MSNKITNIMISHHGLLEMLFTLFREDVEKGRNTSRDSLLKFKWEESKHIFAEEAAIFNFTDWKNGEISKIVKLLEEEHRVILNMLEKFETNMPKKDDGDLAALYKP